jgi:hypothetical protein
MKREQYVLVSQQKMRAWLIYEKEDYLQLLAPPQNQYFEQISID